jgi:hypothetical protein
MQFIRLRRCGSRSDCGWCVLHTGRPRTRRKWRSDEANKQFQRRSERGAAPLAVSRGPVTSAGRRSDRVEARAVQQGLTVLLMGRCMTDGQRHAVSHRCVHIALSQGLGPVRELLGSNMQSDETLCPRTMT